MKTNDPLPTRVALLALLLAVILGPLVVELGADTPEPLEAARSAILSASASFSRAYVEGDMETLAGLYTEDAVLLPPELPAGEVRRGPQAAADYFRPRPGRRNLSHAMRPDDLVIQGAAVGDLAVDTGVWTNVWQPADGTTRRAEGRYLVVWRRGEDGRWRIAYDMWHRPAG